MAARRRGKTRWILRFLWIIVTCCFADDLNGSDCNIEWDIVLNETLAVVWSGEDVDSSATVDVSFERIEVGKAADKCLSKGQSDAEFPQKRISLPKLCPNTEYSVSVTSENCIVATDTKTVWTPPGPPLNLAIQNVTNTSFVAAWDPPSGAGLIEIYIVNVDGTALEVDGNVAVKEVTGIEPFTLYEVQVSAKNKNFFGEKSDKISARTKAGIPSQPTDLQITSSTNTSLFLTWMEPVPSTGHVERYDVEWADTMEQLWNTTTSMKYHNMTKLDPYTNYTARVRATTTAGTGPWSEEITHRTEIGVPRIPENFTVTLSTNTSIHLEWEEPAPSTGPILNYTVKCSSVASFREVSTTDTELTVSGLIPFTTYMLRVSAFTEAGAGNWSEDEVVRTDVGIPHPPDNFTEKWHTNTSIYIQWDEPQPSTGPILHYTVKFIDGRYLREVNTTATALELMGLKAFTVYSLAVSAVTEAGAGNWSQKIIVKTDVGVPSQPTDLRITSSTNTSLFLTWMEPAPSVGSVGGYDVEWADTPGQLRNTSTTTEMKYHNMTNLNPYTNYTARVRATTTAGTGPWSEEITHRTEIGVPSQPTDVRITSSTNISLFLAWMEPLPSTGPLEGYDVEWADAAEQLRNTTTTSMKHHNITNLNPYTNYTARVRARTSAGTGPWSEEIMRRTEVGVPSQPTDLRVSSSTATSLLLFWKEPFPSTGSVEGYDVEWRDTKTQNASTKSSFLYIAKLSPYTNYTARVRARTSAGTGPWSQEITRRTEVGVPSRPRSLAIPSSTSSSLFATWERPLPSTGPIEAYEVSWGESLFRVPGAVSTETSFNITRLKPFTTYSVKVRASTSAGYGPWSEETSRRTDVGVPKAPTSLKAGAVTNTTVALTWKEPAPYTGPVSSYLLGWAISSGKNGQIDTASNLTTFAVSALLPYVVYTFDVSAVTSAGRGMKSRGIVVRTGVGVPHAPTGLKTGTVTNTSISMAWQEPSPSTGPVLTYVVWWCNSRGSGEIDTRGSNVTYVASSLLPYTNYTFRVLAMTSAGRGKWSENNITLHTDIGIPSIPRNLALDRLTDVSASIWWDMPEFANAPDLQYEVRWAKAPEVDPGDEKYDVFRLRSSMARVTHRIPDLLPYTNYSVRVAAITGAGQGPWTELIVFQTAVGVPKPAILLDILAQPARSAFVMWTTSGPFPGPVDYSLQAWKYPGPCSNRSRDHVTKEVTGSQGVDEWSNGTHTNTVTGLTPYGSYYFLIVLRTSSTDRDGIASVPSRNVTIAPEAASEPTDLSADCGFSSTQAKVSWKPPKDPNGQIRSYNIEFVSEGDYRSESVPVTDPCKGVSHLLRGLKPEHHYRINVRANVAHVTSLGKVAQHKEFCTLPAGVPSVGNTTRLVAQGSGSDRLALEWTRDAFSDMMGSITHYAVLVGKRNSLGNATRGKAAASEPPWSNFSIGFSDFYQATPPRWTPFGKDPDPLHCSITYETVDLGNRTLLRCWVGAQGSCLANETYCNGPLKADTQYEMKIRGFTRGGYAETHLFYARTGLEPRPSMVGTVVALIVVLLLAVGLGGGGYFMKRNGYLEPLIDAARSRFRTKDARPTKPINESPLEQLEYCCSPRPIKSKNFADHVKIMMSDSHLKFSLEFEFLMKESPRPPCSVAESEENRPKNRWMNIFPFDHSRVKLLPLCDDPGSDYINANYIPGCSSQREYIATQGPLPHTLDDFWRMVWEQSVSTIVMVTQCVERGKKKCEQYWPDSGESKYYGDLRITNVSESMLSSYVIRIFQVRLGSNQRRIKQMHFTQWPDFGCPESPVDLINFVGAVRDHLPRIEPGPILVHCSAGVGRTGTFIAVDRLALQLRQSHMDNLVDVYSTVLELRNHRTNMVQTEDQYIHIHLCVQQLILERDCSSKGECDDRVYSNIGVQRNTTV